jgi:surface protein
MELMFYECNSLKNVDLSNFNTQNVNNMYGMFCGCNSLKKNNVKTKDNKILNLLE